MPHTPPPDRNENNHNCLCLAFTSLHLTCSRDDEEANDLATLLDGAKDLGLAAETNHSDYDNDRDSDSDSDEEEDVEAIIASMKRHDKGTPRFMYVIYAWL